MQLLAPRGQAPLAGEPFHRWTEEDGTVWSEFHRQDGGFLLRFPDHADFQVMADGADARCWPAPGADGETVEHLFLNQVVPLMLSARGALVFHGSAVRCDGGALAFMGASGRGKSTLAASYALSGSPFLSDDVLRVEAVGGTCLVHPGHPSIRLWRESREALLDETAATAPPVSFTDKERFLAVGGLRHCTEPLTLRAAFFLGTGETDQICIERLRGADALAAWMSNVFVLDVEDRGRIRRNLEAVSALAETAPAFTLDYPRAYASLPELRRVIDEKLQSLWTSR